MPLFRTFEYKVVINEHLHNSIVGCRVLVDFGRKKYVGIVYHQSEESSFDIEKIKEVNQVDFDNKLISTDYLQIYKWVSDYYIYPYGDLVHTIVPKDLKRPDAFEVTIKSVKTKLREIPPKSVLSEEQQQVYERIILNKEFAVNVLYGITGSGKTEVYIELAKKFLLSGKQVLVIVPEINLTPQLKLNFADKLGCEVVTYHSGVSSKKKSEIFIGVGTNECKFVLGTRSSVFLPFSNLGLIIVDEEHDDSLKQQSACLYNARDVSIKIAQHFNIPIILGSATPSVETWKQVEEKKYSLHVLKNKFFSSSVKYSLIDCRHNKLQHGFSNMLISKISEKLKDGKQVFIFKNQRGYSPSTFCLTCKNSIRCKNCSNKLTFHMRASKLICHHCNYSMIKPKNCNICNNELISVGMGTEKIEESISKLFPNANVLRVDSDLVSSVKKMDGVRKQILSNAVDIIVGTQMLSKGHHFPNLSLVALIDVDSYIFSSDYRSSEKFHQLFRQIAGRSGREGDGEVVIQSQFPEEELIKNAFVDYTLVVEEILNERRTYGLPPSNRQIIIRCDSKTQSIGLNILNQISDILPQNSELKIFGPLICSQEKRKGMYRTQLIIQSSSFKYIRLAAMAYREFVSKSTINGAKVTIDVDPRDTMH